MVSANRAFTPPSKVKELKVGQAVSGCDVCEHGNVSLSRLHCFTSSCGVSLIDGIFRGLVCVLFNFISKGTGEGQEGQGTQLVASGCRESRLRLRAMRY